MPFKKHRPWSEEDDRRLREMLAKNKSRPVIAAALKRSVTAIGGRLYILRKAQGSTEKETERDGG